MKTGKSPLRTFDTVDDKKEISSLLDRLPPRRRVQFLQRCCHAASLTGQGPRMAPYVLQATHELAHLAERDDSASERLTVDINLSLWCLANQWQFNINKALNLLVQFARGKA